MYSFQLSISRAMFLYWLLCIVPSPFSYIMSNSWFHFLIESRLVFPTKTVLFLHQNGAFWSYVKLILRIYFPFTFLYKNGSSQSMLIFFLSPPDFGRLALWKQHMHGDSTNGERALVAHRMWPDDHHWLLGSYQFPVPFIFIHHKDWPEALRSLCVSVEVFVFEK